MLPNLCRQRLGALPASISVDSLFSFSSSTFSTLPFLTSPFSPSFTPSLSSSFSPSFFSSFPSSSFSCSSFVRGYDRLFDGSSWQSGNRRHLSTSHLQASEEELFEKAKAPQYHSVLRELVNYLPKAELHVHLDGSLREKTLVELCKAYSVPVPLAEDGESIDPTIFKPVYTDLEDYLRVFSYTVPALQRPEALQTAARELMLDHARHGVRYLEVRFAPQLHMPGPGSISRMSFTQVLQAVNTGLNEAKTMLNRDFVVPRQLPFEYGIVVCALRNPAILSSNTSSSSSSSLSSSSSSSSSSSEENKLIPLSPHYAHLLAEKPRNTAFSTFCSLRLAEETCEFLSRYPDFPLVGFDLAGGEYQNPASEHEQAFAMAHARGLGITVHAGEADSPHSIFQAIHHCRADRIGHGTHLFDAEMIPDSALPLLGCCDRAAAAKQLVRYLLQNKIHLEVCLTSNQQTLPHLAGDLAKHPLKRMLDEGLSVSLCSDNLLVSRTNLADEYFKAVTTFDLSLKDLINLVLAGHANSFFPGDHRQKLQYQELAADNLSVVAGHWLSALNRR